MVLVGLDKPAATGHVSHCTTDGRGWQKEGGATEALLEGTFALREALWESALLQPHTHIDLVPEAVIKHIEIGAPGGKAQALNAKFHFVSQPPGSLSWSTWNFFLGPWSGKALRSAGANAFLNIAQPAAAFHWPSV